ncbi:ATP-utilizing enzyme [Nitzschia inconspicua]|uniref:ATP-utilizing enzyme n=1 Tax=Nitzschia inconspicua TaxID=303405 RepID=A0A9K3KC20_9STRA|nr:ATP-utilizing enzyme [Nitzschia inconspicua]
MISSFRQGMGRRSFGPLFAYSKPIKSFDSTKKVTNSRKRSLVHVVKTSTNGNTAVQQDLNHGTQIHHEEDPVFATKLVDELLKYTESLMKSNNNGARQRRTEQMIMDENSNIFPEKEGSRHHIIAFSGGIDSSVVTALIHHIQQNRVLETDHQVTAVLGLSPALSHEQRILAEQVAMHIGVEFEAIPTTEGDDELYRANDGRACLACKTHLYTCLNAISERYGADTLLQSSHNRLYNGTNADDLQDPTRLGLIAANNFDVQSPLQHTSKSLVRMAGKHLGLPNWNYAASPCLRSRLAIGVPAVPDHLRRIEQAERFVRDQLSLPPSYNMRVRSLAQQRAMIEVDDEWVELVQERINNDSDSTWRSMFVETLGFRSVNVRPFKTGSVAAKMEPTSSTLIL